MLSATKLLLCVVVAVAAFSSDDDDPHTSRQPPSVPNLLLPSSNTAPQGWLKAVYDSIFPSTKLPRVFETANLGVFYVDGVNYDLTRAGIAQAITDAYNPNARTGGTVYVMADIVSDGIDLPMATGVTVDFMGHSYLAPPSFQPGMGYMLFSPVYAIPSPPAYAGTTYSLTTNVTAGNGCMQLPAGYNPLLFQPGQYVEITNGSAIWRLCTTVASLNSSGYVCVTDIPPVTLLHPAITSQPTISRFTLRNVIFDYNNSTAPWLDSYVAQCLIYLFVDRYLAYIQFCTYCRFENIEATGTAPLGNGYAGVFFMNTYGCTFRNIGSNLFRGGNNIRDIDFWNIGQGRIDDIYSYSTEGFGPGISNAIFTHWTGLHVTNAQARGFRVDQSLFCSFSHLFSVGNQLSRGTGISVPQYSNNHVFSNVVVYGNSNFGLVFSGNDNTVTNFQGYFNGYAGGINPCPNNGGAATDLAYTNGGSYGNKVTGHVGCPVMTSGTGSGFFQVRFAFFV